jgi:hypothetical protein
VTAFWDTTAVLPLLMAEPATADCRSWLATSPRPVVWWGTGVECASALARRRREGCSEADVAAATVRLEYLASRWSEIVPSDEVRGHARRLLNRHPLRAPDALHLAAALTWADARPNASFRFQSRDHRLVEAARAEGFSVVVPQPGDVGQGPASG